MTDVLGLAVVLAGSGALGAFASALLAWLRLRRHGDAVRIRVRNEGGATIELAATNLRGLSGEEVRELTQRISDALEESRIADDSKPDRREMS
ncbi:hypothetical protein [Nonomuraea sp. NPDC049646]|uniref:effector-associated constant component EACC1 n=1 Tax=unclassified Nonomuraea TaxID=2593643 RepID=UPI00379DF818